MSEVKYIVVHCSDSPNGLSDSRLDTAGDIHRWHKLRGWDGIGYHFVIDENGCEQAGRPVFTADKTFWPGAHCRDFNHCSLGICLIGRQHFHAAQLETLRRRIESLIEHWPYAKIVGHRDLDSKKTCPNFDVEQWWKTGAVSHGLV